MTFLWLLLVPLGVLFASRVIWPHKITWKELALGAAIIFVLMGLVYATGTYRATGDVEIWNGEITNKQKVKVSCEHSYDCFCVTSCSGSGQNRQCHEVCQTCYDHTNDWDWRVMTNLGDFNISRIDRRGADEPPRWSQVAIGQPVAEERRYTNYVRAVPESLFLDEAVPDSTFAGMIPAYPRVYDYHYADRVHAMGVKLPDQKQWSLDLANILKKLGPAKQVNVQIIFVNTPDQSYRHAVERAWLGGKKNDVVLIVGVVEYPKIAWVDIMTFALNSGNELFQVSLRDAITEIGVVDREKFMGVITEQVMTKYDRPHMRDYEYLKDEMKPPVWVIILCIFVGLFGSISVSYMAYKGELE